jgi:hypothetical protein
MIKWEPTGKNLAFGFCGNLGPISGASTSDSAWSIKFKPNRSAAAGSSRTIYLTICSRSFLLRAEKTTSQAMNGRLGEVDSRCRPALGQFRDPLRRMTPSVRRAPLRLGRPTRIVARAIACSICSMLAVPKLLCSSDLSNCRMCADRIADQRGFSRHSARTSLL